MCDLVGIGIASCYIHCSSQSFASAQVSTLSTGQFDRTLICKSQGVCHSSFTEGLWRISCTSKRFIHVIQIHLGQYRRCPQSLSDLFLHSNSLLGACNVGHSLIHAGQILLLGRAFSHVVHDRADLFNLRQTLHTIFHLIEVDHRLHVFRSQASLTQFVRHAHHMINHGRECFRQVASSSQLGCQIRWQLALSNVFLVLLTIGKRGF